MTAFESFLFVFFCGKRHNACYTAFTIILVLFFANYAFSRETSLKNNQTNDWNSWGLTGKVKSIEDSTFEVLLPSNENKQHSAGMIFIAFNKNGNVSEKYECNKKGEIRNKSVLEYDEKGDLKSENHYGLDGNQEFKLAYKYKNGGRDVTTKRFDSKGNITFTVTYHYSKSGFLIQKCWYNPGSKAFYKWTYLYDKAGNLLRTNSYDLTGFLSTKDTVVYNDKGEKMLEKIFNSKDSLTKWITFSYNDAGDLVRQSKYNPDNSLDFQVINNYNKQGTRIESEWSEYSNGNLTSKSTGLYDNKGNLLEAEKFNSGGKKIFSVRYKYVYDEMGNWTKQIEFEGNTPKCITERTIHYF